MQLKRCPICDGEGKVHGGMGLSFVRCHGCGIVAPGAGLDEAAVRNWNSLGTDTNPEEPTPRCCPDCGGKVAVGKVSGRYYVYCLHLPCGMSSPKRDDRAMAIRDWNSLRIRTEY